MALKRELDNGQRGPGVAQRPRGIKPALRQEPSQNETIRQIKGHKDALEKEEIARCQEIAQDIDVLRAWWVDRRRVAEATVRGNKVRRVFTSPRRGTRATMTSAVSASGISSPHFSRAGKRPGRHFSKAGWRWLLRACIAKRGMEHRPGSSHAPHKSTRDLGMTGFALAVVEGNLRDAVAGTSRLHQHFNGPAKGHLAHPQCLQRNPADHAKRANIMQRSVIHQIQQARDEPVSQTSLEWHSASFSAPGHARTHHQVSTLLNERSEHSRKVSGIITSIAIHKNQNLSSQFSRCFRGFRVLPAYDSRWLGAHPPVLLRICSSGCSTLYSSRLSCFSVRQRDGALCLRQGCA